MPEIKSFIDAPNMLAALKADMSAQMMAAAEPVIQQAVKDAEIAIRKQLGSMFIALIDRSLELDRRGEDLRILVKQVREAR